MAIYEKLVHKIENRMHISIKYIFITLKTWKYNPSFKIMFILVFWVHYNSIYVDIWWKTAQLSNGKIMSEYNGQIK